MNLSIPDDEYFSNILNEKSLIEFVIDFYKNWGSRLGVIIIQPIIEYYSFVFLLLNILINISVMFLMAKVLCLRSVKSHFLLLSLMLMFNIHNMSSAGWMTTMINYLWPISALLLMVISLKSMYDKTANKWNLLILIPCLFFLGTHEQGVVMLLPMYVVFLSFYFQRYGKLDKTILISVFFCFVFILMILLSPGNAIRAQIEMTHEWSSPLYAGNNLIDKIWLGVIRFDALFLAVPQITNHSNFMAVPDHHLTYVFAIILLMHSFVGRKEGKRILEVMLACVPVVILVGYLLASYNAFFTFLFAKPGMPYVIDYSNWSFYSPLIFSSLFVVSIVMYLYIRFNHTKFILYTCLLFSGLATQVMMGLSPTIYRSGARTSSFIYFTFVALTMLLFQDMESQMEDDKQKRHIVYGLLALILMVSLNDCLESFLFLAPRGY